MNHQNSRHETIDGQHVLVIPAACCEACKGPANGRLVSRGGTYLCLGCDGDREAAETYHDEARGEGNER